jgi:hypothetical protein
MISHEAAVVIEFVYFLVIFLLSLSIYVQTRRMHFFSFHRGIRYFRNTFLSFSMVYFFRFVGLNLQTVPNLVPQDYQGAILQLVMFLVVLFSFFAILCLLSSFSWKRYKFISDTRVALVSVVLACVAFFARVPLLLLAIGIGAAGLLVVKAVESARQKTRVLSPIFVIYTLLLVFVLFDLVPTIQALTPIEFEVAGYVGSACVFVYLNLKVRKVLTNGKEEEK